ncbi:MAG: GNAT family N-acetyltransferase [Oscillospiraceae bacterium]|nr:GNAT family N-acetyltransferase [Oscillospiraceae bacterium]
MIDSICNPNYNDIEQIKKLLFICFQDDLEDGKTSENMDLNYINFYIDNLFEYKNCFIYKRNNDIISTLFSIPTEIYIEHKKYKASYIYAACTLPEYRSKGIMKNLINYIWEYDKNRNYDFSILVPGEKSLFDYYSKLGYKIFSSYCRETLNLHDNINLELKDINIEKIDNWHEFLYFRNIYLKKNFNIYAKFENFFYNYVYKEISFTNGVIYKFSILGEYKFFVLFSSNDDSEKMYIKETNITLDEFDIYGYTILRYFNIEKISINIPCNIGEENSFSMYKKIGDIDISLKGKTYFNFVLD